jgi:molybdopterin-guanine dinucleotide biosynthesis protein A
MTRYKDSSDDAFAEYSQAQRLRAEGALEERSRLIKLLKEQNVIRNCAATGKLVFVNCNTLEVLYLKEISDE